MNTIVVYLITINILTFIVMFWDKLQASSHSHRVRERTLFLLTLLGGSPAMLFSMYTIRHKTQKASFKLVVWIMVLVHLAIVVYLLS